MRKRSLLSEQPSYLQDNTLPSQLRQPSEFVLLLSCCGELQSRGFNKFKYESKLHKC